MEHDVPHSPISNANDSYSSSAEDNSSMLGDSGDVDDYTPVSDSVDDNDAR